MKTNTDVSKALASKLSPVALAVAMTVPAISNIAVAQEAEATEEQQFELQSMEARRREIETIQNNLQIKKNDPLFSVFCLLFKRNTE